MPAFLAFAWKRARLIVGVPGCLFALLLLACAGAAQAAEPARLQGCKRVDLDRRHLEVAQDPRPNLPLEDALRLKFEPASGHRLNFGVTGGSVWLRFALQGGGCDSQLFLDLGNPFVNRVLVYREAGDGGWTADWAAGTGPRTPVDSRLRYGLLPVDVDPLKPSRFMVEIGGPAAVVAAPAIVAGNQLTVLVGTRMLLGGLFAGGIVALAVYCACLAALTRFQGLLAYAASALAYAVFYGSTAGALDGVVLWMLPHAEDKLDVMMRVNGFAVLTSALFHWLFVNRLLLERPVPVHQRPAVIAMLVGWATLLACVPLVSGATLHAANMLAAILTMAGIAHEVRRAFVRGHPLARVTAIAFGAIGVAVVAFMGMYSGLLPWHPALLHVLAVGAWVEAILLSVAVGTQVKTLQGQHQLLAERTRELSLLSQLDPLTGLGNRRAYDALMPAEIERCQRRGRIASLLVVDIDHFKRVNDTWGHVYGDSVIRALGSAIANSVRSTDFAFRYGGEEFVVLLPGLERVLAFDIARRIMQGFTECGLKGPDGTPQHFTVSIGLAQLEADDDAASLFGRADAAMYRAKQNGRARAEVATPGMPGADAVAALR